MPRFSAAAYDYAAETPLRRFDGYRMPMIIFAYFTIRFFAASSLAFTFRRFHAHFIFSYFSLFRYFEPPPFSLFSRRCCLFSILAILLPEPLIAFFFFFFSDADACRRYAMLCHITLCLPPFSL